MVNVLSLSSQASLGAQALELRIRLLRRVPTVPLPKLLEELTPHRLSRPTISAADVWPALRVCEAVCRRIPKMPDTCLYRALTRYTLLRRAGYPANFVMGMEPRARPGLTAHAWVELDGKPYHEALDPGLVVTYVYPDDRFSRGEATNST